MNHGVSKEFSYKWQPGNHEKLPIYCIGVKCILSWDTSPKQWFICRPPDISPGIVLFYLGASQDCYLVDFEEDRRGKKPLSYT